MMKVAARTVAGRVGLLVLAVVLAVAGVARADNPILYATQTNPPAPGVPPGVPSYQSDQSWPQDVCGGSDQAFPKGSEIEWAPVLDPGQDAETNLIAASGTVVYNPQPNESGYCAGNGCPGQPFPCSSDANCASGGGTCDLGQGPSCTGGSYSSPWQNPQAPAGFPLSALPLACVSDAQCPSGCTCTALGRSRGDVPMTHPFGFDWDTALALDPAYLGLLARGNVESAHLDPTDMTGQTALGGFEDIVYPYLHATTPVNSTSEGWCTSDYKTRCASSSDCPAGSICEGAINGLGIDPSTLPGTLGMETDHDIFPDSYQPHDGDRAAVFGRWIVDCGHGGALGFHTEIHPPLLFASGRQTGSGSFGAKCSGEQTCTSAIGRPFLVSQNFGDGPMMVHISHEMEKLGCVVVTGPAVSGVLHSYGGLPNCDLGTEPTCVCNGDTSCELCEAASCAALAACATCPFFPPDCLACAGAPFGLPCTTQLEERPHVNGVPFVGTQDMQYYVQPANARLHAGDRMLVKWQMTARHGVNVALSSAGDAGVLVDVTMDQSSYHAPALPSAQDWIAPRQSDEDILIDVLDTLALIFPLDVPQAVAVSNGLFTDRRQAPPAPANDTSPNIQFADQLDATMQAADIDDSQVFPVSGRLNVGWFRCSAGGPYGATCAGPRTSVKLDGGGSSDPDGNPLTYTWTGPFLGGTATGVMPTVKFMGGGTFPVTLTVSNGTVSTSCSSTVTIHPAAVLQLGGAPTNVNGSAGGINGDVCIGPNASLAVTGAQSVTGTIYLAPGDPLTKSGTGTIGPVLRNQDLSARIADATSTAADLAALPCTQTFATWKTSATIVGNGGQNVVCVGDVTLSGSSVVTLSGGAHDTFVVKITGKLKLTDSSKVVASGVPRSAIVYDVVGAGQQVVLSSLTSGGPGCCSASLDGTLLAVGRAISFGPGLVNGEVISGQSIGLGGGSSVR